MSNVCSYYRHIMPALYHKATGRDGLGYGPDERMNTWGSMCIHARHPCEALSAQSPALLPNCLWFRSRMWCLQESHLRQPPQITLGRFRQKHSPRSKVVLFRNIINITPHRPPISTSAISNLH